MVDNKSKEELFTLAYDMHGDNLPLIIAPCNLAKDKANVDIRVQPAWLATLYKDLGTALSKMPI